jgi:hypothetical protein
LFVRSLESPVALTGAERQANYIARLKARAAHADVLAVRLAAIEAQQADARLTRQEARHETPRVVKRRGRHGR